MRASWVLLTQGDRSGDLAAAVSSIAADRDEDDEIIVVGNGCALADMAGVIRLELPENVGIPEGRNRAIPLAEGELICFLDDDARLLGSAFSRRLKALFGADEKLGIVTFRITDTHTGLTQRRHVPRVRNVDPDHSSPVTTFLGGACAVRASVFAEVGTLPGSFFYALEETDFAWRALDAGWTIRYDSGLVVHHPATAPSRHPDYVRRTARNRVWLARRRLPAPVAVAYVCTWTLIHLLRSRSFASAADHFSGTAEGLRSDAGERRPMGWGTVLRMTRLGRPPVV